MGMLDDWCGGEMEGLMLCGRMVWWTYEWKSATMALSPSGIGMYSLPAPLMMVRGTYF